MASISTTGTSACHLLSRSLQPATSARSTPVAEQASVVHSLVRGHCRYATRSSRKPKAPRCSDWLLECSAYVGTDLTASPTYPLCGARRRSFARPPTLGSFAAKFLLACRSAQPHISGKVRCRPEATLSQEPASVLRGLPAVIQCRGIQRLRSYAVSRRLGRLLQAALRWTGACIALPGTLHPSRGHLQSPFTGRYRWRRDFPMEGLRASQQVARDDSYSRRVLAPLLPTRPANGLSAYSLFRHSR